MFKKSSGTWECDACMVNNKSDAAKCVACEAPKPGAKPPAAAPAPALKVQILIINQFYISIKMLRMSCACAMTYINCV